MRWKERKWTLGWISRQSMGMLKRSYSGDVSGVCEAGPDESKLLQTPHVLEHIIWHINATIAWHIIYNEQYATCM